MVVAEVERRHLKAQVLAKGRLHVCESGSTKLGRMSDVGLHENLEI